MLKNWLQSRKLREVVLHIVFWISVWFFYVYFFSYNASSRIYILWFSSALLPVTISVTYIMIYLLIPRYLLTKKYKTFAFNSFYVLVFSAYMVVLVIYASLMFILKNDIDAMPPMAKNFVSVMILVYLVVGIVSMVFLLNHNFKTISKNKELQNKILNTQLQLKEQELSYLKMQIHPHFLFNTLNTIYGLALKESSYTPDVILKLSNLLDYILYRINKPLVNLNEEVDHIKEYIELEKIRFEESLKVEFHAGVIDSSMQVAPMLLIPFVENAFKHGSLLEGYLHIHVKIIVAGNQLTFQIRNTSSQKENESNKKGIGLENIRKRLDMHYPGNYNIKIENSDGWFIVQMDIFNLNQAKK